MIRTIAILISWMLLNQSAISKEIDVFSLSFEELMDLDIQSASGFLEKAVEAPAPVSIITREMIENSGVSTIRDLLTLYIPSYTQVQDQNEYNVAFRGIYTSSQQKFLIMLNGHRLNSRAYSMANPDHAIALEKVKQIEVIRGPGSSVYGNIALTSVVNIISKTGNDTQGLSGAIEIGNHGFKKVYLQLGGSNARFDHFSWLKAVKSDGEAVAIHPENDYSPAPHQRVITSYLDAFKNETPFDLGSTINFVNDLNFLINYRRGHYIEPLTSGGISGEAYDASSYPKVNGVAPGAQSTSWHSNVNKTWELADNNELDIKFYFDTNEISGPVSTNPATSAFLDVYWKEYDYGVASKWTHQFDQGLLMLGIDHDYTKVTDSRALAGSHGAITGELLFAGEPVLGLGSESVTSAYLQYKHDLTQGWVINSGLRYDKKKRLTGTDIDEFSPRLAVIYQHNDSTYKLSFSRSFVDPPYWNRYSKFGSFRGSSALNPEILESYQFTPEFFMFDKRLQVKLNAYYNRYQDVVFRRTTAEPEEPLFVNSGTLESMGLEYEWLYLDDNMQVRFIGHHYGVKKVEGYGADNDEIFNIPRAQFNLIIDRELSDQLSVQASLKYLGSRRSPINIALNNQAVMDPFPNQGVRFQEPHHRLPSTFLLNTHFRWKLTQLPMTLTLNVQNILDKKWQQGGSVVHPYRQTGRWFKLGVEYQF